MIQPSYGADFPVFRRHYTRLELADKVAEVRRKCAAPLLVLVTDNDVSDMTAIAVTLGHDKLRLTPYLMSREMYIALHCMTLTATIWEMEKEHWMMVERGPVSRVKVSRRKP